MARVTGPLMSVGASGTLAKTLTFAKWKGRSYCRQRVIPANPKSPMQLGTRAMLAYIAARWASVTSGDKTTWDTLAEQDSISAFNAFCRDALTRWQQFLGPRDAADDAAAATALAIGTITRTGASGYATLSGTPDGTTAAQAVAIAIFRSTSSISACSWANCVGILPVTPGDAFTYTDSPLDAGTYHYRTAYISADGVIGTPDADGTAVVT